jgi:uncharacterized protein involved in exopolysaccharide biosynthesis
MDDLTEARRVTETVTAEQIVGMARDAELVAVLEWLTGQSFAVPQDQQDLVLLLRDCLRAKAHR